MTYLKELTEKHKTQEKDIIPAECLDENSYTNERGIYKMEETEMEKTLQNLEDRNRKLKEHAINLEKQLCLFKELLQRSESENTSNISFLSKSLETIKKDLEELKNKKQTKKRINIIFNKQKQIIDQIFELEKVMVSISELKSEVTLHQVLSESDGKV